MDLVALGEQELGEVRPVLARDAGDERALARGRAGRGRPVRGRGGGRGTGRGGRSRDGGRTAGAGKLQTPRGRPDPAAPTNGVAGAALPTLSQRPAPCSTSSTSAPPTGGRSTTSAWRWWRRWPRAASASRSSSDPEWHASPTPADVVFFAHRDHYRPGFPYRDWAAELAVVVHDPDEVSTFYDRLSWPAEPMHERPELAAFDRVLTCSREMVGVLGRRYGLGAYFAPTHPHNARRDPGRPPRLATATAVTATAVTATAASPAGRSGSSARPTAPSRSPWRRVLARAAAPRFWTHDERGRFNLRQARSALIRQHRKNTPWLDRLADDAGRRRPRGRRLPLRPGPHPVVGRRLRPPRPWTRTSTSARR